MVAGTVVEVSAATATGAGGYSPDRHSAAARRNSNSLSGSGIRLPSALRAVTPEEVADANATAPGGVQLPGQLEDAGAH